MAITRKLSELEKKVQELNTVSAHLNLVPSAAKVFFMIHPVLKKFLLETNIKKIVC